MNTGEGILLLGASGFFGPALVEELGASLCAQTYLKHRIEGGVRFDALQSSVREVIAGKAARPVAAVVLFAETNIDACAADPASSAKLNVEATVRALRELSELAVMPVFLSSDGIFDGTRANWKEEDEVHPILTYGRQKLEVEWFMATLPPPWLILRLPKLLSVAPNDRCILTQWIKKLGAGGEIPCATDQYFTLAEARDVARAAAVLIGKRAHGIYHLGGPERLSRRALLQAVVDEYGKFAKPKATIAEMSLRDIRLKEARPLDTSMSTERLVTLCGPLIRPSSTIARLAVRRHFGKAGE